MEERRKGRKEERSSVVGAGLASQVVGYTKNVKSNPPYLTDNPVCYFFMVE
jgi:hypothetical protein